MAIGDERGRALEEIVVALGKFYGAMGRDEFVSRLLLTQQDLPPNAGALQVQSNPGVTDAARAFLSVSDGGYTTPDLVRRIADLLKGDDATDADKEVIRGLIKICYEEMDDDEGIILKDTSQVSVASGPGSNSSTAQGVILGNSQSKFSVKDIAGIESSEENINSTSATSSSSGVSVSAIQVFGNRISAVNREMGAITLFLNAIPTHEISRAVPFIDMVLVQEGSNFTFDNKLNN